MGSLKDHEHLALHFITSVQELLQSHQHSPDAGRWLDETRKPQLSAERSRTVIGVVGATGAGKSALMNALLDEERILPTSCMRACTAVVTEVSYNNSDMPYRAEIEFVDKDEWRSELKHIYGDILTEDGTISRDSQHTDTEAGVSYSKLKTIYSDMSKEQLAKATLDELLSHKSASLLGTVQVIEERAPKAFYDKIQEYVDSRDKIDFRYKSTKTSAHVLEYWPLIRVVKLFVKSQVLRSGAVLVDLPGIHDSNAARAAVAQSYLKQCATLFIVAPITRAVDDKSAKHLLGQSFKQQLKLDGSLGNITFICSKTDDVVISEVRDSLDVTDSIRPAMERVLSIQTSMDHIAAEHEHLQIARNTAIETLDQADNKADHYLSLLDKSQQDFEITKPILGELESKRKRPVDPFFSRKRTSFEDFSRWDSDDDDEETHLGSTGHNPEDTRKGGGPMHSYLLTVEDIESKIVESRKAKEDARLCIQECDRGIRNAVEKICGERQDFNSARNHLTKLCIMARNEYSRTAIKRDFAAGVEEIDQELAIEDDPNDFDPSQQYRDYDEVADNLPVFCVSSRAYQKLEGRFETEKKIRGFGNIHDTEIPQLQHHVWRVADEIQVASQKKFIDNVTILFNSLKIWTLGQDQTESLTEKEILAMEHDLNHNIDQLSKSIQTFCHGAMKVVGDYIETSIVTRFAFAIMRARDLASDTVAKWNKPIDRDSHANSGIRWSTYKAITRRNGSFANKETAYNFNRELINPLVQSLANGWEKVFVRLVPAAFKETLTQLHAAVESFRGEIAVANTQHGIKTSQIQLLEVQLASHAQNIIAVLASAEFTLKKSQKNINREFVALITEEMSDVYTQCTAERGPGMYVRLKRAMEDGVRQSKNSMFDNCTTVIRDHLRQMVRDVEAQLQHDMNETISRIRQDYLQLATNRSHEVLAEDKVLKEAIMYFIYNFEAQKAGLQRRSSSPVRSQVQIKAEATFPERRLATVPLRSITPQHFPSYADEVVTREERPMSKAKRRLPSYDEPSADEGDIAFR